LEGRIQRVHAATAPPGDARDGWKVLGELCGRFDASAAWNSAAEVFQEIMQAAPRYAAATESPADGWKTLFVKEPEASSFVIRSHPADAPESGGRPYVLAWDGVFDWGDDPLVSYSPTLSRDYHSLRKLFPKGFVEMSKEDADALGVRAGWRVKLTSIYGEAVVPIRHRKGLRRGVMLAPHAFRDHFLDVLREDGTTAVNIEPA